MPSKTPALGSRNARRAPIAIPLLPPLQSLGADGSFSRPYVLDSDNEEDAQIHLSRSTHTKRSRIAPHPVQLQTTESSDDEPLINRIAARKSARCALPAYDEQAARLAPAVLDPHIPDATPLLSSLNDNGDKDSTKTSAYEARTPSASKPSVYGEQTNLIPAFQSVSRYTSLPSGQPSSSALSSMLPRVPTPERLFTNMRLRDVNKLILTVGKLEGEEARRRASARKRGVNRRKSSGIRKASASKPGKASVSAGVVESPGYDEDDGSESIDVKAGGNTHMETDDSDGTLADDHEDDYAASPAAAKKMRISRQTPRERQALSGHHPANKPATQDKNNRSRIGRAARAISASNVIDLTEDQPTAVQPATPQHNDLSLADRLFPKSPSPPVSSERAEVARERETAFMHGFDTQWWMGGKTYRATIVHVNAALQNNVARFTEAEGMRRLRSLFAKGKLAIRHDLVYHLDEDPGVEAPRPAPLQGREYVSSSQRLLRDLRQAEFSPQKSPFGRIREDRYRVFEAKLHSAVMVEETLFKNKEKVETLFRCMGAVNEWMNEDSKFSLKEVSAALTYLSKMGKVKLMQGEEVKLVGVLE